MSANGVCACHRYRPDVLVSVSARLCDLDSSELIASLDAVIRPLSVPASWTPEPKPAPARDGALAIMPGLGPQSIL